MLKRIFFSTFAMLLIFLGANTYAEHINDGKKFEMAIFIAKTRAPGYTKYDFDSAISYINSLKVPDGIPYSYAKTLNELKYNNIDLFKAIKKYASPGGIAENIAKGFIDGFTLNVDGLWGLAKDNYNTFFGKGEPELISNAREKAKRSYEDACLMMNEFGYTEDALKMLAFHYSNNPKFNDGELQNSIALGYEEGKNFPQNITLAIIFLEDSADKHCVNACLNLSKIYYFGGFTQKKNDIIDINKAIHYADLAKQYGASGDKFEKYYSLIKDQKRNMDNSF